MAPAAESNDGRRATVVFVSMQATASSHSFRIRLSLPNPERDWKAGQKMLITFDTSAHATPPPGKDK